MSEPEGRGVAWPEEASGRHSMSEVPGRAAQPQTEGNPGDSFGNVGFIGLGVMGRPMAENLLAAGADPGR